MVEITNKRIADFIEPFRVKPGSRVRLPHDFDPSGTRRATKAEAKAILAAGDRSSWPSTRCGSPPRTTMAWSCSSRRWTPPARTAPSGTS